MCHPATTIFRNVKYPYFTRVKKKKITVAGKVAGKWQENLPPKISLFYKGAVFSCHQSPSRPPLPFL
jgi:hypothetical protein